MNKFEKDLTFSYPTGVVPMANATPLEPTPTYTPVVRGSALANVSRPSASNVVANQNVSPIQQLNQSDILFSQLKDIDAQIVVLNAQFIQADICLKNTSKINDYYRWYNCQQTYNSVKAQLESLTIQRDNIAQKLYALGRPIPRKPNLNIESRNTLGATATKIAEDVATNVTDALQNVPGIGGMLGGGGGGGAMGGGEDQTQEAPKSFFEENKIPILILGGSLAFLILKN
jgi:hypothetical protein